jgi:glycosyltransferase involved in cell wall biosynthesis
MIKYSIIIPTLNEEKLLPRLLEVIDNADLRKKYNYEIIISDGGSSDKTLKIAEKHADIILKNKDGFNQNISMGRNVGANAANGEILIFYNGDIYIKNFEAVFTAIINSFLKHKYLAMTCCVKVFPEEQKFVDIVFQTFYNYYFHFLNIIGLGMGRGECHIIKKSVFYDYGGYNEDLAAGEDFDLFRRIRKDGKILFARNLTVYESPRRYRKIGHFRILFTWLINSIYIIFAKSSKSTEWKEVR